MAPSDIYSAEMSKSVRSSKQFKVYKSLTKQAMFLNQTDN